MEERPFASHQKRRREKKNKIHKTDVILNNKITQEMKNLREKLFKKKAYSPNINESFSELNATLDDM